MWKVFLEMYSPLLIDFIAATAPGSPEDIKVFPTSPQSLLVSWIPPNEPNGAITKYNLYIRYNYLIHISPDIFWKSNANLHILRIWFEYIFPFQNLEGHRWTESCQTKCARNSNCFRNEEYTTGGRIPILGHSGDKNRRGPKFCYCLANCQS